MKTRNASRQLPLLASLLLVACSDQALSTSPENPPATPAFEILDAARSNAAPGFYFLSPMVPMPASFAGTFDPGISPVVEVCLPLGRSCGAELIAQFNMGSGSDRVRREDEHYIVNWNTRQYTLDASKTYRIRVRAGGTQLGFADVKLVRNGNEARSVDATRFIALTLGSTLPIKFRVERGAVPAPGPTQVIKSLTGSVSTPIGLAGGSVSVSDADGIRYTLTIPPGALRVTTDIKMTPIGAIQNMRAGAGFTGGVHLEPEGTSLWIPATLTMQFPAAIDPRGLYGFAYSAGGADLNLVPANVTGNTMHVSVSHFSGAGSVARNAGDAAAMAAAADRYAAFKAELAIVVHDAYANGTFIKDDPRAADIFNRWGNAVLADLQNANPGDPSSDPMAIIRQSMELELQLQQADMALPDALRRQIEAARIALFQRMIAQADKDCRATNKIAFYEAAVQIAHFAQVLNLATNDNGLSVEEVEFTVCATPVIREVSISKPEPLDPYIPVDLTIDAGLSHAKQPAVSRPMKITYTLQGTRRDGTFEVTPDIGGIVVTSITPDEGPPAVDVRARACIPSKIPSLAGICDDSAASWRIKQAIRVEVTPEKQTLDQGAQLSLNARVTNSTKGVVWTSTGGTVNGAGLYVAPNAAGPYKVIATSVEDPTKSDFADVTVNDVTVAISPANATTKVNQSLQFNAAVTGAINKEVTWTSSGGSITDAGVFSSTEPGTFTVTATSVVQPGKSASAEVTVKPDGLARIAHLSCRIEANVTAATNTSDSKQNRQGEPNADIPCSDVQAVSLNVGNAFRGSIARTSANGSVTAGLKEGDLFSSLTLGANFVGNITGSNSTESDLHCSFGSCADREICAGNQCSFGLLYYLSILSLGIQAEADIDVTVTLSSSASCSYYDTVASWAKIQLIGDGGTATNFCAPLTRTFGLTMVRGQVRSVGGVIEAAARMQNYGAGTSATWNYAVNYTISVSVTPRQ